MIFLLPVIFRPENSPSVCHFTKPLRSLSVVMVSVVALPPSRLIPWIGGIASRNSGKLMSLPLMEINANWPLFQSPSIFILAWPIFPLKLIPRFGYAWKSIVPLASSKVFDIKSTLPYILADTICNFPWNLFSLLWSSLIKFSQFQWLFSSCTQISAPSAVIVSICDMPKLVFNKSDQLYCSFTIGTRANKSPCLE